MAEVKVLDMDEGMIVSDYRQAKDKRAQVKILAQLNACGCTIDRAVIGLEGGGVFFLDGKI